MEEWKQDVAIYYDDAKEVLSWLFDKPLASRLTAEEKEKLRSIHYRVLEFCDHIPTGWDFGFRWAMSDLNALFGKDFFKEDKV